MAELIEKLVEYLQLPLVRNAFIVATLIALCSSFLGVTLVLKRFSYVGTSLSHVAFGAMTVGLILNLTNNMFIVLPVTIGVAIILLNNEQNGKVKADALIAMLSVSALAIGYLLLNIFSSSSNLSGDICATLFGSTSILTLSTQDVILCITLSVITVLIYIIFYNKIYAITFDESFAKATGVKEKLYNNIISVVIAIIIVLGMNLVGSLLVSALIIFPALSSMKIFRSYKNVVISSAIISVVGALLGVLIAVVWGTPVGSTIVAIDILIFLICMITSTVIRRIA